MISLVKMRAPRFGVEFSAWAACFSAFECSLLAIRGKEDSWNPIISGAATGMLLASRSGFRPAVQAGVFGGAILGLIEGVNILVTKATSSMVNAPPQPMPVGRSGGPPAGGNGLGVALGGAGGGSYGGSVPASVNFDDDEFDEDDS